MRKTFHELCQWCVEQFAIELNANMKGCVKGCNHCQCPINELSHARNLNINEVN